MPLLSRFENLHPHFRDLVHYTHRTIIEGNKVWSWDFDWKYRIALTFEPSLTVTWDKSFNLPRNSLKVVCKFTRP